MVDIEIFKGSRFLMTVNLQQKNAAGDIIPFDATGFSFRGQIRRSFKSTEAFDFSFNVIDLVNGQIEMVMDATVTETLPEGENVYDVEVFDPVDDKIVYKALYGNATVFEEVTRD